jgi:hypothetical protein
VWNPYDWEQLPGATPFAEASYVLSIWDDRGPGATAKGGYFSPYSGTKFGIYRPQAYTALSSESMSIDVVVVLLLISCLAVLAVLG